MPRSYTTLHIKERFPLHMLWLWATCNRPFDTTDENTLHRRYCLLVCIRGCSVCSAGPCTMSIRINEANRRLHSDVSHRIDRQNTYLGHHYQHCIYTLGAFVVIYLRASFYFCCVLPVEHQGTGIPSYDPKVLPAPGNGFDAGAHDCIQKKSFRAAHARSKLGDRSCKKCMPNL